MIQPALSDETCFRTEPKALPLVSHLPKVVQIGFNKCATRSLTELFAGSGHKAAHHKFRKPFRSSQNIAQLVLANKTAGRRMFAGFEDYDFYADMVWQSDAESYEAFKDFDLIYRDYPDTFFLLNHRDRENWINSRMKHGHGDFVTRVMAEHGFETREECAEFWRRDWDEHLSRARSFFAEKPGQLIEFNTDKDSVDDLITAFPDYKLQADAWGDVGRSRGRKLGAVSKSLKRLNAARKTKRNQR